MAPLIVRLLVPVLLNKMPFFVGVELLLTAPLTVTLAPAPVTLKPFVIVPLNAVIAVLARPVSVNVIFDADSSKSCAVVEAAGVSVAVNVTPDVVQRKWPPAVALPVVSARISFTPVLTFKFMVKLFAIKVSELVKDGNRSLAVPLNVVAQTSVAFTSPDFLAK